MPDFEYTGPDLITGSELPSGSSTDYEYQHDYYLEMLNAQLEAMKQQFENFQREEEEEGFFGTKNMEKINMALGIRATTESFRDAYVNKKIYMRGGMSNMEDPNAPGSGKTIGGDDANWRFEEKSKLGGWIENVTGWNRGIEHIGPDGDLSADANVEEDGTNSGIVSNEDDDNELITDSDTTVDKVEEPEPNGNLVDSDGSGDVQLTKYDRFKAENWDPSKETWFNEDEARAAGWDGKAWGDPIANTEVAEDITPISDNEEAINLLDSSEFNLSDSNYSFNNENQIGMDIGDTGFQYAKVDKTYVDLKQFETLKDPNKDPLFANELLSQRVNISAADGGGFNVGGLDEDMFFEDSDSLDSFLGNNPLISYNSNWMD